VDDVKLFNFTITPGITPAKNFTLRAEYRVDAVLGAKIANPSGDGTMIDAKEQLNTKSSQHTIAIGAHYTF
jgi:opacity protein-like surface antigen